jgi:hypothetical protein
LSILIVYISYSDAYLDGSHDYIIHNHGIDEFACIIAPTLTPCQTAPVAPLLKSPQHATNPTSKYQLENFYQLPLVLKGIFVELFATDLERIAFLLEGDASLHLEQLLSDAAELVTEELPEEKRPSLLRTILV